jgi:hypothetical protein
MRGIGGSPTPIPAAALASGTARVAAHAPDPRTAHGSHHGPVRMILDFIPNGPVAARSWMHQAGHAH